MHAHASNSELVEPLPEPERTLNRRLRRRNRRVPFNQRNNPPQHLRIFYSPILDINHFRHFLIILENIYPMDDEPMWATDCVVTPTLGSAITIPETANEFAIKGNALKLSWSQSFQGQHYQNLLSWSQRDNSRSPKCRCWFKENENVVENVVDAAQVSTAATTVAITTEEITLAQALEALKTSKPKLKFNSIKDAKKLLEAVEKRFGGNAATKKTQRNLLKQQYENFSAPSSEMLNQTFDRLQKLNTHVVVWRNKADLDTMSMNDLYNNLKVYEPEVKGMSSSSSSTQNMAFVSSSNNNTSSTNETVNNAHRVSTTCNQVNASNSTNIDNLSDAVICAFFASQPNSPQLVHADLQQIHPDDMEEMDLR
ncbi:hypothetical protein Tco_1400590 [Tanacetum coccineum]